MKKYWVRSTYWTDDFHLEPGNPHKRVPFYLAADVEERDQERERTLDEIRTFLINLSVSQNIPAAAQRLLKCLEEGQR